MIARIIVTNPGFVKTIHDQPPKEWGTLFQKGSRENPPAYAVKKP
jgi:hypothetical protein